MKDFSINRRQFLQFTAAGVAAAALPFGTIQAETSQKNARIVILGCGLAGWCNFCDRMI
ncbi:MAG: twin-arginine translocation signal domain-containing protein [Neisseriaceae bacterium]|nr:twin-arginine translocation signal domain-containing protein [Neisseriaceae bacterium]